MQVSKEEIIHIAKLANLNLLEEEVETYRNHLEEILNFANIVNHTSTEGVKELEANSLCNVFREDKIKESIPREELLQNAPEEQEGMFKIPKVIN